MSIEFSGSSPIDQQRQTEAVARFGLLIDGGEGGAMTARKMAAGKLH